MLKLITPRAEDFKTETPTSSDTANNVFKVFHGFYGNLFLSKFVTGQVGADGIDQGVVSARAIWAHGLRDYDAATVKTALMRVIDVHQEYPPTLPQFVALCRACKPREVYREALPPAPPDPEVAGKFRERAAQIRADLVTKNAPGGMDLLKQAIADAVRCAGGNEGAELARLDRMFVRGAA